MGKMTDALRKAKLLREQREGRSPLAPTEVDRLFVEPAAPAKPPLVVQRPEKMGSGPDPDRDAQAPSGPTGKRCLTPFSPPPRKESPAPIPEEEFRPPWSIEEEEPPEAAAPRAAVAAPIVEEPFRLEDSLKALSPSALSSGPKGEVEGPPAEASVVLPAVEPEVIPPVERAVEPAEAPAVEAPPAPRAVLPQAEETAAPVVVEAPAPRVLPQVEPTPAPSLEPYLSVHYGRDGRFADEFRKLKTRLSAQAAQARVILVISCVAGEGRTTVAVNLATSFANTYGEKVVLVDGNAARPKIGEVLGLAADAPGLEQAVRGLVSHEDAAVRTEIPNLWAVKADAGRERSEGLLESSGFRELVNSLRRRFTRVVIDLPPSEEAPESLALASQADVVLVTAMKTRTRRRKLRRLVEQLKGRGAARVLCVFVRA